MKAITTTTVIDHAHAWQYAKQLPDPIDLPIDEVANRIVALNNGIKDFWSRAEGWAPIEAAHLLSKSRLDWQVSLSSSLKIWFAQSSDKDDGRLILAWVNLGSLVEGSMKLFLSVYYDTYKYDADAIRRKGKLHDPDGLQLEPLRLFFKNKIWGENFDKWIEKIQRRRNAIHAYENRDIGSYGEFLDSVRKYLMILRYINYRLPYPADEYMPKESRLTSSARIVEITEEDNPFTK